MYLTAEVRWFFPGTIDPRLAGWFEEMTGGSWQEEPRVDHYLRLAGTDSLGVKVREGGLELKQRTGEVGLHRFVPHVTGKVELWRKWRLVRDQQDEPATAPHTLLDITTGSSEWFAVQKKRLLALLAIENGGVRPLPVEQVPGAGCEVELTRVSAEGRDWSTLALEAFGNQDPLEILLAAAGFLFRSETPIMLTQATSYGYPRWLNLL